jgi:hypothetical protein
MTNAAQCEKFHPFAVSALDRLRSRLSASLGTQQSAGAGCNSIQSSRGGPQGCGRVVAAWLRGIGKSCSPRDPFLRHRVGTFDAFLPCELGRRREATLVSAVGPFCAASGEDRASGYQTKIPFRVAATMATAASTNTERQAQTQIAASSASDLGMCFVPGSSSCKHHRAWCRSTPQNHSDKNVHRRTKLSQGGFLPSLPCFGRSRLRPASPQLQKLTSARPGAGYVANTNRPYRSSSPLFTKCSESKQNSTYSPHSAPANPGRTSNH